MFDILYQVQSMQPLICCVGAAMKTCCIQRIVSIKLSKTTYTVVTNERQIGRLIRYRVQKCITSIH